MATPIAGMDIYAPVFKVMINGVDEQRLRDSITGIDVDEDLENPGKFTISLNDILDIQTQKFKWLDNEYIAPGTEAAISFGYAGSLEKEGLIRGRIKALTPGFSSGTQTLSIEGYDFSYDLKKTEGKMSFLKAKYSDVAESIASDNNLETGGIEDSKQKNEKIDRNKNEKDHAMLKRLAKDIGYEFFVRDRTLYFRQPDDRKKGTITFQFRNNFINFNPRMTTANLVNEVWVTAWNQKDKKKILEKAVINDIKSGIGIPDMDNFIEKSQGKKTIARMEGLVVRSREEAKALALAELKHRNNFFIQGSLECPGNPKLRPSMTVNIEKIGKRFSGVYYITKARHAIGDGGYKTTLEVRRCM
jgi:phage protein D